MPPTCRRRRLGKGASPTSTPSCAAWSRSTSPRSPEHAEAAQRKEYLDAQDTDLTTALETLEDAIRKIDRETRGRFKDTFDRVNSGVQELYPRLFGGGHAYLELTGEDLLDTGVAIMARPPGKRVSNISLLSGGEKAMTAVALVFAIFRLNPAPFCLLDEVDAPLDEANVGRFTAMVSEMSEAGTVPVRHPQQGDDGSRAAAVGRHHARAGREPPGLGGPGRSRAPGRRRLSLERHVGERGIASRNGTEYAIQDSKE